MNPNKCRRSVEFYSALELKFSLENEIERALFEKLIAALWRYELTCMVPPDSCRIP